MPLTLDDLSETQAQGLKGRLLRAARKRASLFAQTDALRVHDADADELQGLTVDLYGDWAALSTYTAQASALAPQVASALLELGLVGVYLKTRRKADLRRLSPSELPADAPLTGAPCDGLIVHEAGRRYHVRLDDGLSTGLFLDQRDNRSWLQGAARGLRVLNLFAYTCSFSVAAGLGGASQVTSVDLSGSVLRRGAENLALNQLDPSTHRLLRDDARKWVPRAVRRADRYDLIVLDPPSFSSHGSRSFSVARDYGELVEDTIRLLAPGGALLCVTNHRATRSDEFADWVLQAAQRAARRVRQLVHPEPPLDCPPARDGSVHTKSLRLVVE